MSTQVETEAKYDLGPGDPVPDLVGVAGVAGDEELPEQELVAVYHDTEDLRLTAAATTLRRRTGGSDDGWHLKLPLGPGQRLEVHRPLGRARAVPRGLSTLVRAQVGSAALVPVATLTTTRRRRLLRDAAGTVLAELADDTVRAERHGREPVVSTWRELEVELVAGTAEQLAELDDAIRRAGLLPAATGSKVGRVLAAQVRAPRAVVAGRKAPIAEVLAAEVARLTAGLRAADPQVRVGRDGAPEQLAAAAGQLRGLLAAFRHRLDPAAAATLAPDALSPLADLERVAGAAADAWALATTLPDALAAEPPELRLGPTRRLVARHLAAHRKDTRAALLGVLDAEGLPALLAVLDALAAGPPLTDPGERAGHALRAVTRRSLARVRRRGPATGDQVRLDGLADAVHRLGAAVAISRPVVGDKVEPIAATTAQLAALLREHHSTVVSREALRLLAAGSVDANGFTFGRLHAQQELAGRRARRRLDKVCARLRKTRFGWVD